MRSLSPEKQSFFGSQEVVGSRRHSLVLNSLMEGSSSMGCLGLWNINVGHGRQEIAEAAHKQMKKLSFYPSAFEYYN